MKPRKNKHLPDDWYCEINYNSFQKPSVFFIFARANFPDSYRTKYRRIKVTGDNFIIHKLEYY